MSDGKTHTGNVDRMAGVIVKHQDAVRALWTESGAGAEQAVILTVYSDSESTLHLVTEKEAKVIAVTLAQLPRDELDELALEEVMKLFDVDPPKGFARLLVVDGVVAQVGRARVQVEGP